MSKLVRSLLHELRVASPEGHLKENLAAKYILDQFRKYETTEEQLCKARDEMKFLGTTYLTYLQSSRRHQEIHQDYKGKGERSIEETAGLVGFKLPHDPK